MTEVIGETVFVSEQEISEIIVPSKRLRQTMRDITSLADSMSEIGLLHPITITNDKVLISGLHRLRAAESIGWKKIKASVLTGDELDTELAEIDENLISNRLNVAEQSHHIARREEIMKARGERAQRGGYRGNGGSENEPLPGSGSERTTEELARDSGMAPSTYRRRAQIGRGLTEETLEIISDLDPNDSDLPNSTRQLNYLAGVDEPEDQEEIARRVATGEAVSVWEASKQLKEERGEVRPNAMQESMDAWARTTPDEEEEPLELMGITKAGPMEYVVKWSDGSSNRVTRQTLLSDHGFKKCKNCSGYGIVEGKGK